MGSIHEIRILSKAGEGAFGSVYVGRWRNIVVAVKIIKDTSGTRSLKTAWELAVNKSLSHPSIVTVRSGLAAVCACRAGGLNSERRALRGFWYLGEHDGARLHAPSPCTAVLAQQ